MKTIKDILRKDQRLIKFTQNEIDMIQGFACATYDIGLKEGKITEADEEAVKKGCGEVFWNYKYINYRNSEMPEDIFENFVGNYLMSLYARDEYQREIMKLSVKISLCDLDDYPNVRDMNKKEFEIFIRGKALKDVEVSHMRYLIENFTSKEMEGLGIK